MNLVWGLRADAMTSAQRFVLLALADVADDVGFCYPSTAYIDHKTGMSTRTVRHHLLALEETGWFKRKRALRGAHRYYIDMDKLTEHQRESWRERVAGGGKKLPPTRQEVAADCGKKLPPRRQEVATRTTTTPRTEPKTTQAAVKTNTWDGPCSLCGCVVEAGTGRLVGKKPTHLAGKCATPSAMKDASVMNARTEADWLDR